MGVQAQEAAKYRITYDCEAEYITGSPKTYRWAVDIGQSSAVFYNANHRGYVRERKELMDKGNTQALVEQLPALGKKYPARVDLQIVWGAPEPGKYTFCKLVRDTKLRYEETLPTVEWQMTDSLKTICEYECQQAVGTLYGRTWTVWFTPELPLSYGPYLLGGLPGMILAARDAEGTFSFTAVGVEEAPGDAKVGLLDVDDAQKCSRKRYLEMRVELDGLSQKQILERALAAEGISSADGKVKFLDANGKAVEISDKPHPKKNYLDLE